MTRAVDNGQGIQDPRVSRQHLKVMLAHGEAYEPNGVCRVQALGHNPSTIKRGKLCARALTSAHCSFSGLAVCLECLSRLPSNHGVFACA